MTADDSSHDDGESLSESTDLPDRYAGPPSDAFAELGDALRQHAHAVARADLEDDRAERAAAADRLRATLDVARRRLDALDTDAEE